MNGYLLLMGIVIIICVGLHRFTEKIQIPSLLIFIGLGMCFGINGIFRIDFSNYEASEMICSVCLIFVMFYGGFGTSMREAHPVAVQSFLLSTLGVAMTAGLVGVFVHLALGLEWTQSLLIGSVVASTDAASVFNILRSKKLNLMSGESISIPLLLFKQIAFGLLCGLLLGKISVWVLNNISIRMEQGETIFVFAVAILAYALAGQLEGNGYLSVYLCGILMGNSYLPKKRDLVRFFDVITNVAQMMIFFLLGLLVTPVELPQVLLPSLLIMVFMTFIGRPIAVGTILLPFKTSIQQVGVVSWAGLRGVASIVFAIYAVLSGVTMKYNLFNLVFCIVLLSLAFQGALLPAVCRKLKMIDRNADVLRTFNDYREVNDVSFVKIPVGEDHPWSNGKVSQLPLPKDFLIMLVMRKEEKIVPNGDTVILPGDLLVIAARAFEDRENLTLREITVDKNHRCKGKTLEQVEIPQGMLIIMVQRGGQTIIPRGDTLIEEGDMLVAAQF